MRIVHFTKKRGDCRAVKAAFYQKQQGHEVILVWHQPGACGDKANIQPVQPFMGLPTFVGAAPDGHDMAMALKKKFRPDVVHAHEQDQLWMLTHVSDKKVAEAQHFDNVPLEQSGVKLRRAPFPLVYDAHEDELGQFVGVFKPQRAIDDRAWINKVVMQYPDAHCVASPGIANLMRRRNGISEGVWIVNNAPPKQPRKPNRESTRWQLGLTEKDVAVFFCGYATPERKLHELCLAVNKLGWRLFVMGDQSRTLPMIREELLGHGAEIIDAQPYPYEHMYDRMNMLDILSAGDVGFAGAELEVPNWQVGLPNKAFEYPFSYVPVCASKMPDTEAMLEAYEIGNTFDGTARDLIEKLPEAREIGINARRDIDFEAFIADMNFDDNGGPAMMDAYTHAIERYGRK